MRMMGVFEKGERIRHIGHLDIQRSMQRGLRRSGLPVAYSNGFNPHILISFASALSTGAAGKREIMDVTMTESITAELFLEKMNRAMPQELHVFEAKPLDDKHPAMMNMVRAAEYLLRIDDPEAESMISFIPQLLEKEEITAMRKTKTTLKECNIRPLILSLSAEANYIRARLVLNEREACKPGMLLEALSREAGREQVPRMLVTRTGLLGENEAGELVPLETL